MKYFILFTQINLNIVLVVLEIFHESVKCKHQFSLRLHFCIFIFLELSKSSQKKIGKVRSSKFLCLLNKIRTKNVLTKGIIKHSCLIIQKMSEVSKINWCKIHVQQLGICIIEVCAKLSGQFPGNQVLCSLAKWFEKSDLQKISPKFPQL